MSIKPGDKIQIMNIASNDAFYSDRSSHVGKKAVVKTVRKWIGGSWFEGIDLNELNGEHYIYLFKAQLKKVREK